MDLLSEKIEEDYWNFFYVKNVLYKNVKFLEEHMRKFFAIMMIAVASTSALVGCGGNQTPVENSGNSTGDNAQVAEVKKMPLSDLLNQMLEQKLVRMPMPIDETLAQDAYHIDLNVVDEYAIAETGVSPGPGLIVMVKAKPGKLEEAKTNMETLLHDRIGSAFYPEEKEAAEEASIVVDGDYVALFILNEEAEKTATDLFMKVEE